MAVVKNEGTVEWLNAGRSVGRMYGNFFFWLFREPFPSRQLGQQIVSVMLEAFGVMMITAVIEGGMFAWIAGWDGGKFSVINWAWAASLYLLLASVTTLIGAMMFVFYQFVTPPLFFNPVETAPVKNSAYGEAYRKLETDYER